MLEIIPMCSWFSRPFTPSSVTSGVMWCDVSGSGKVTPQAESKELSFFLCKCFSKGYNIKSMRCFHAEIPQKYTRGRVIKIYESRQIIVFRGECAVYGTNANELWDGKRCEFNVVISQKKVTVKETENWGQYGGRNGLSSSSSWESNFSCSCYWRVSKPVWTLVHCGRLPGYIPHCGTLNAEDLSRMLQMGNSDKTQGWIGCAQGIQLVSICNTQVVLVCREDINTGERQFSDEPLPPPAGK